jgi:AcrR family transcriptional regulator
VPRLWSDTIRQHRRAVHDATLDTTADLLAAHGRSAVTMSRIAQETGIGRATLYKYFSDVDAILVAWHERQVNRHLESLEQVVLDGTDAGQQLRSVLSTYAHIRHRHHATDLAAELHREQHAVGARDRLLSFVSDLAKAAAAAGDIRDDVPAGELAAFAIHALDAASALKSAATVERLVSVTWDALTTTNDGK